MGKVVIAGIGFSLLALTATPVSAVCAWILWSLHAETTDVNVPIAKARWRGAWSPVSSHETKEQCEASLTRDVKWIQSPEYAESEGYKRIGGGQNNATFYEITAGKGRVIDIKYACWPDTVDPRKR